MRIKRELPPTPRPATKPYHSRRVYYGEGAFIYEKKRSQIPSHMEIHERKRREGRIKATAVRMGNAERRRDMVKRLALEGCSTDQIAEKTGYKPSSVTRMLTRLRHDGEDVPMMRGRGKA